MNFRRNKKNNKKINVNRLQFVMAIIFLLVGFVLFKLYELQILKYDLYVALAMDQHQVFSKLNPERGKIFVQNDPYIFGKNLYPVATNKEFVPSFLLPLSLFLFFEILLFVCRLYFPLHHTYHENIHLLPMFPRFPEALLRDQKIHIIFLLLLAGYEYLQEPQKLKQIPCWLLPDKDFFQKYMGHSVRIFFLSPDLTC